MKCPAVRSCLALLLVSVSAGPVLADQQSYPFRLVSRAGNGRQVLFAENKGPAPVLMTLDLKSDSAIIEPAGHVIELIQPASTEQAASIRAQAAGSNYRVASNYHFSIGDPDAVPDTAVTYQLPFANGQKVSVGQILGGTITTHTGPDSKYAVDFDVPIGTPIHAARGGIVVDVDQRYTQGGNDPRLKANHVMILHDDGTLGLYAHLSAESHVVKFGQRVATDELIGYSGNTGYSTGPHLHFSVLTNTRTSDGSAKYLSHSVTFVNGRPLRRVDFSQGQVIEVGH